MPSNVAIPSATLLKVCWTVSIELNTRASLVHLVDLLLELSCRHGYCFLGAGSRAYGRCDCAVDMAQTDGIQDAVTSLCGEL